MKKITRVLAVMVIAMALFTNFDVNSNQTEADMLALNVADAVMFIPEVKCASSSNSSDYCVSNGNNYGCKNTIAADNCDRDGAMELLAFY